MAVLILVTLASAAGAWANADKSKSVTLRGPTLPNGQTVPGPGGGDGNAAGGSTTPDVSIPSYTVPSYTPPTYSPPPVPTPTYLLDPTAVARTLDGFMNALTYHDLATTRSLVCPKFRANYTGTYFDGNEIAHWQRSAFDVPPNQNWIAIYVAINLRNPNSGAAAGTYNHNWIVEKDDGQYFVCGYET